MNPSDQTVSLKLGTIYPLSKQTADGMLTCSSALIIACFNRSLSPVNVLIITEHSFFNSSISWINSSLWTAIVSVLLTGREMGRANSIAVEVDGREVVIVVVVQVDAENIYYYIS